MIAVLLSFEYVKHHQGTNEIYQSQRPVVIIEEHSPGEYELVNKFPSLAQFHKWERECYKQTVHVTDDYRLEEIARDLIGQIRG